MKKFLTLLLFSAPLLALGQFGVSYHQTNLPFFGASYEIKERLRPEIRIGTDNYFESISVEGALTFDFINREDYEFYGGIGIRSNDFAGLTVPVGFNFYPFTRKNFGFHVELTPILGEDDILRGSWGIRYRFRKE